MEAIWDHKSYQQNLYLRLAADLLHIGYPVSETMQRKLILKKNYIILKFKSVHSGYQDQEVEAFSTKVYSSV